MKVLLLLIASVVVDGDRLSPVFVVMVRVDVFEMLSVRVKLAVPADAGA